MMYIRKQTIISIKLAGSDNFKTISFFKVHMCLNMLNFDIRWDINVNL